MHGEEEMGMSDTDKPQTLAGGEAQSGHVCDLRYLMVQKVVIVGASVHIGWSVSGCLAPGASWGHHTSSREGKKTGVHL